MTNVPLPSFGDAGFTSPAELDIYDGVIADLSVVFGGNLNPGKTTPQGQLSMSLTAVIGAFNDLFVDYTNEVDPARNSGRMQDGIARIYFLTREPATPTIVEATLSGLTGTVINAGSLARAADGTIYASLTTVTIPPAGNINAQFEAIVDGPIACPAGTLNTIYRTVPGWDSITNVADGAPGTNEETPADFEARRAASVAQNATGILAAIRGVLLGNNINGSANVPGILDAYVTENDTSSAETIGGVSIPAKSLYVCVEGGTDADVAKAIWSKKPPGCGYGGSTTVTVLDTNSGYITPPAYSVTFQRAAALPMNFVATLANGSDVPSDALAQITNAISTTFAKLARIGQTMYASSFVCAIGALGDWVRLESLTINGGSFQTVTIGQFPAQGTVGLTLA